MYFPYKAVNLEKSETSWFSSGLKCSIIKVSVKQRTYTTAVVDDGKQAAMSFAYRCSGFTVRKAGHQL